MATVTNVRTENGCIVKFHLTDLTTNSSSQEFSLHEFENKCSIKMILRTYDPSYYLYKVTFSLDFTTKPSLLHNKLLQLTVCFNSSVYGHLFTLKAVTDTNFRSQATTVYDTAFNGYSSFDADVEINFNQELCGNKLAQDMKQLFLEKAHSDLELVVDEKVFKVHKNILSVRSKVLCKMIETEMIEKKTGTIKLEQWDGVVVEQLLNYIYTDTCDMTITPFKLFQLSHYLEITPLEKMCKGHLQCNINVQNIVQILELANEDQYELSDLKTAAEKFVKSNEAILAKESTYVNYLIKSINLENIAQILTFSQQYTIDTLMDKAIEYILSQHQEALKIKDCNQFFVSHPSLMLRLLGHSLQAMESMRTSKNESH